MGLVASSSELPLFDLLQVKSLGRATCRISVSGREQDGTLYLEEGHVVHATYGDLRGEAAAYAILAEPHVQYSSTTDVAVPAPNMRATPNTLALEAARRADEAGRQVVPIGTARAARTPADRPSTPPRAAAAGPARSGRRPFASWAIAGAALLAAGGGAAVFALRPGGPAAPAPAGKAAPTAARAPAAPPDPAGAIEASALRPPSDSLPVLVQGAPPRSPDPAAAFRPTVVCRLLVGADGAVVEAEIYQRRPDLGAFEEAALQAVRGYRFEPARRAGTAVAVWINWPIDFI